MRNRNHANALQHGAFSKLMILPWEHLQQFEELHADLIEEWKPDGPTEHDAVFTIAKGMWRKRRMQHFLSSEIERHRLMPNHAAYDEITALRAFSYFIETAPDEFDLALEALTAANADHLRRNFPKGKFQTTSEWVRAIQNEVSSILLPAAERFGFDKSTGALIARDAAFFSQDIVKYELAVEERIDAMIDRAVKRLVQAKAMKQIMGTTSATGGTDQPKKLPSNKPEGSAKIVSKRQNGRRSHSISGATETPKADPPSS
jgi:hypothetical protein